MYVGVGPTDMTEKVPMSDVVSIDCPTGGSAVADMGHLVGP